LTPLRLQATAGPVSHSSELDQDFNRQSLAGGHFRSVTTAIIPNGRLESLSHRIKDAPLLTRIKNDPRSFLENGIEQ
jgi:hypothetical protein